MIHSPEPAICNRVVHFWANVYTTTINTDITTARSILGGDKLIGISANSVDEAVTASVKGADYLGIGTIFSTQTWVMYSCRSPDMTPKPKC